MTDEISGMSLLRKSSTLTGGRHAVDVARRELHELKYHDPVVRQAFDLADHQGLSGEDRYVLLAYHAVLRMRQLERRCLELLERLVEW